MAEDPIRFGILGCASIARKISRAIHLAPNSVLHAIGSRSIEKARSFVAALALPESPKAYGSYDEVVEEQRIDAVYLPLPTSLHVKWAVAAAERRKHVLLEKPTALCASDLEVILEACRSNGVQFMDATMWLHHPRTTEMRQLLSDPCLFGETRLIHSSSTFSATKEFLETNIRVKPDMDSLGALGDLGWYCIGAILWAVDYQLPQAAVALPTLHVNPEGVILACGSSFHWEDGKVATFHCSFLSNVSMQLSVHGTVGSLQVTDLAIPYQENSASFEFSSGAHFAELHTGWSHGPDEILVPTSPPQEALMIREFAQLVKGIRGSDCCPDPKWPCISRKNQLLLDAVKRSIELGFQPVRIL